MCEKQFAPVAVFGYNRADKLQKCIEMLEKCELANKTELFIFADGPKSEKGDKDVNMVHQWVREYKAYHDAGSSGFKSVNITIKEKNAGLAISIIGGTTKLIDRYGKVIVVEDDLLVQPNFLSYMNAGLDYYKDNKKIWEIASYGYNLNALKNYKHDIYLSFRASSWGWATWKDRWDSVDWEIKDYDKLLASKELQKRFCRGGGDLFPMLQSQMNGEIDSWAIRWNYAGSKRDALTVYPKYGLVRNYGFDGSGIHTGDRGKQAKFFENVNDNFSEVKFEEVVLDPKITREFYLLHTDTFFKKVKRNLSVKDIVKLIKRAFGT